MARDDILFCRDGGRGHVVLNRPNVLNAVSHDMLLRLEQKLLEWKADSGIALVTIAGAGDRAFAAGGDIRDLYENGRKDGSLNYRFYEDEYRVNILIKRYSKPCVSFVDGINMGGGVGLSVHASYRVAGERTVFAMPETGIGLFPDVGGSYFLSRMPGGIGLFLGLTGTRLKVADCVCAKAADAFVPSKSHREVLLALSAMEPLSNRKALDRKIAHRLAEFSADPGPAPLAANRRMIDQCFQAATLEEVLSALSDLGTEWSMQLLGLLATKSPTSLKVAFRQLRLGAGLKFEDCMRMEYRLARACMDGHDFYEGVRAVIVDKDNDPHWKPPTIEAVKEEMLDAMFAPIGPDELDI